MTLPQTETITLNQDGPVLHITLNRPDSRNAMSLTMVNELMAVFEAVKDDADVRAIVLRGAGGHFCAGGDIKKITDPDSVFRKEPLTASQSYVNGVQRLPVALYNMDIPTIAAVNGPAVGIGTTMLLHCDLIYVAQNARLKMPFVNLGLCPEAGSSFLLPRLLGHPRAAELLLLGEEISGTRACEIGLANQALPAGQAVLDAARAAALRIAELPPSSVQLTKRLIRSGVSRTADEVMETEGEHFATLLSGAEAKEALTAFMEKRKPVFN